jgi:hypothetical protein
MRQERDETDMFMFTPQIFEDARLSMIAQQYADEFNRQSVSEKKVIHMSARSCKFNAVSSACCTM